MLVELLSPPASKYQDCLYPCRQTGMYIGDGVTYKYGVMHVNAQFVTSAQQHAWPRLPAKAVLIFCMRAIIDALYAAARLSNFSQHEAMNFLNSFYRDDSPPYTGLIGTNKNAMACACEPGNGFF
jgi:hypothetical protein